MQRNVRILEHSRFNPEIVMVDMVNVDGLFQIEFGLTTSVSQFREYW